MLESILFVTVLIICVSYMFVGCAGHRRKTGDEGASESTLPEDQQLTPSQADQAEQQPASEGVSKVPGASGIGNDQSIAGYQSQTSEILAGPGEVAPDSALGASTISRPGSHVSHAGSKMHSNVGSTLSSSHHGASSRLNSRAAGSKAGSTIASGHSTSNVQGSKFGSTLDSSVSRAAGGGPASVLSVLSRQGTGGSNIQSSLSSLASRSRMGSSHMGSSQMGSGITSNYQSGIPTSNLDSSANERSRASNIAQSIISNAGKNRMSKSSKSTRSKVAAGSNVSRVLSSSVAVSGSSPVSQSQSAMSPQRSATPKSTSGSPMSGASVTTPQSSASSRQSVTK